MDEKIQKPWGPQKCGPFFVYSSRLWYNEFYYPITTKKWKILKIKKHLRFFL